MKKGLKAGSKYNSWFAGLRCKKKISELNQPERAVNKPADTTNRWLQNLVVMIAEKWPGICEDYQQMMLIAEETRLVKRSDSILIK